MNEREEEGRHGVISLLFNSQDTLWPGPVTGCCEVPIPLLSVLETHSARGFSDNKL